MIYPGTPISFLPDWLADLWRAVFLVAVVAVVMRMGLRAGQGVGRSSAFVYGRAALFVLLMGEAVTNVERWGYPITWEGLPVASVGLAFAWLAMRGEPPK